MACTAASLGVLLSFVLLWPASFQHEASELIYMAPSPDLIVMEEISPSVQRRKPPPPPPPLPPVIRPDDEILEEPLDLMSDLQTLEIGTDIPDLDSGKDESNRSRALADRGPEPRRIAEPEYPRAARRRNIRAEVTMQVNIDARGRVTDHVIVSRYLLENEGMERTEVDALGFGLEEAAISAASRWMFSPARKEGKSVNSQYILTVRFGV